MSKTHFLGGLAVLGLTLSILAGCGPEAGNGTDGTDADGGASAPAGNYDGKVAIDGSSTVTPVMEAVVEEFNNANPEAEIALATSGTGGGFKKFIQGETDISMASRPIKPEEAAQLKAAGIEYLELPIAYDGLTVVVNSDNDFVDYLTVEELNKIWAPNSTVDNWSQVRAGFPDLAIKLYGPGTDSGTFDYFTDVINGEEGASRDDFQSSEDDNVLVTGVAGDRGGLGYFGYAYYIENTDKLKAVPIDGGTGPILPSEETIANGTYAPLSRPIFIYVKKSSAENNPTLKAMVDFLLSDGSSMIGDVGYVALPASQLETAKEIFDNLRTEATYKDIIGN